MPRLDREYFGEYRRYVRGAGQYYTLWRARAEDVDIGDPAAFEQLKAQWEQEMTDFSKLFFATRERLRSRDLQAWVDLHTIYPRALAVFKRLLESSESLYIVTFKDRRSVQLILESHGTTMAPEKILDQADMENKLDGLRQVASAVGCSLEDIAFIDDNVGHLVDPAAHGVQCYLADWKYESEDARRQARSHEIPVLGLDALEDLFVRT